MAIFFNLGGYGSGKSYDGLVQIRDELVQGDRPVVTNLAVLPDKLNAYLQKKYPEKDCRLLQRLRILTDDEVLHFFCHRVARGGWQYDIPVPSPEAEKRGARPDFTLWRDDGCLFVIDEVHEYFNSRLWMEVGRSVSWYKNQHRKLGDDIIGITPNIEEVEKQLREAPGTTFYYFINLGKRKYKGIVLPNKFLKREYVSLNAFKRDSQSNKYEFELDLELAACYDTARGARGLQGRKADIGKRPKGVPFKVLVGAFIVFVLFLAVGIWKGSPWVAHKLAGSVVGKRDSGSQSSSHASKFSVSNIVVGVVGSVRSSLAPADVSSQPAEVSTNELFCTGFCFLNYSPVVFMSDGEIYRGSEVQFLKERTVQVNGKEYPIRRAKDMPYVPSAPRPAEWDAGVVTPPKPVNQADVLVIGTPRDRQVKPLGGISAMQQQFSPQLPKASVFDQTQ